MTTSTAALLRVLAIVAALGAFMFFGDRVMRFFQAPVQAQLDAARGNNAALKAGSAVQNADIAGLKKDGEVRQAKSAEAVKRAGEPHFDRAKAIAAAPAVGDTDYERATNRIDRELGLQ